VKPHRHNDRFVHCAKIGCCVTREPQSEGDAAIVHDYLYWVQTRPREEANEIFLFAMQDSKVDSALRKAIYEAVTLAGKGAWDNNAKLKKNGEKRILKQFPDDFTITWKDFKVRPGVFVD